MSSVFHKTAHSIFLKIYVKVEGLKDQKLTESSFSEKSSKIVFLAVLKNLTY